MSSSLRPSLWDDSEPLYAPFMKCINRKYFKWVPSKKYVDAGWTIRTFALDGRPGDGRDAERAAECRRLTRDLLTWYDGQINSSVKEGTWGWAIQRYLNDDYSPIRDVAPDTRAKYRKELDRIAAAVGEVRIIDTDYQMMMEWRRMMEKNGRSVSYVAKWFRHFGLALSHAVKLKAEGARDVKEIRSEMRITAPPRRQTFISREQVYQVVGHAEEIGADYIATALMFRFEFLLRGVDVYGKWVPSEGKGGIIQNGKRWTSGLTWEMFSPDLTSFEKVINKTKRSLPEPYSFDLTAVPRLQAKLAAIPATERVGPVIKLPTGTPPREGIVSNRFKSILRAVGLPDELQIRDARAGGITEAKTLVDPYQLRDAAQHTQVTTTDIYARDRSTAANKVVQIRQKGPHQ